GVLQPAREGGLRQVGEVPAHEMADPNRARMRHDRHRALLEAPVARRGAVEDLVDALDLDEVVAAADGADLAIAGEGLARAFAEVAEREDALARHRPQPVRAHEIALLRRLVPEAPDPLARMPLSDQPLQARAEEPCALRRAQRNVAAALEEDVAQA